ncbi:WXG100 family type VII secretion target [Terrabacter sp. NPDC080008]|uniref:WXG100 family type VII secretion target n=1 Tax=Terrabacter sp. NPDC080008 TaxID=3155176 RepID=UPI00344BD365
MDGALGQHLRWGHRRQEDRVLYRKGADPEALDRSARELSAFAGEVQGIRANGTRALAVIGRSWGGADAEAAQQQWRSTADALSSLGSTLDSLARRLTENARAQRTASTGQSPLLGPGTLFPLAPGGPLGGAFPPGSPLAPTPPPFADSVRGTKPHEIDLELAELAKGVYNGEGTATYHPLQPSDLRTLGIDPGTLTGPQGFAATVYRDAQGHYVLAFQGTDPSSLDDWGANLQQGVGLFSSQHVQAITLAQRLSAVVGSENMVLTGHSLGGGLASTASVATDVPAVTFNAAGVHPNTVELATRLGHGDGGLASGQIRNYHVRGEVLTTLQNPVGSFVDHVPHLGPDRLPDALGTQIALDPAKPPEVHVSPWSLVSPAAGVVETVKDLGGYAIGQHQAPSVIEAMEASAYFGKH